MENITDAQKLNWHNKVTNFLERRPVIYQFLRFVCIGFLNTGLAFLVQNSISEFFHIHEGWKFGGVQGIAFVCAVLQSYPWNRTWTFGGETNVTLWKNLTRLFAVGALGATAIVFSFVAAKFAAPAWPYVAFLVVYLVVEEMLWKHFGFHMSDWDHVGHSFAIFFIVTFIGLLLNASISSVFSSHIHLLNPEFSRNIAAAVATAVTLFWNFTGYKVVVFRK